MSDDIVDQAIQRGLKTHEIVADRLRRRIVSGELQVGDRLPPEEELTAAFGIARTTLREALRVLEYEGLLEIRRGRGGGPVVTHPTLGPAATALAVSLQLQDTTIGDLDEARRMIEPQVAGRLALNHTADDIEALNDAIAAASSAAEADDTTAFGIAVVRLHEMLMERSGNDTLATISRLLHELVNNFYAQVSPRADQQLMRRAVRSYRKLVNLIESGDRDAAVAHWEAQMAYTISGQDQAAPLDMYADTQQS